MDYKALIAINLRAAFERAKRARPSLSINMLAGEADLSANTIGNMMKRRTSPRWENLVKVAKALRIAPHTLVIPEDEAQLLTEFRKADAENREFLLKSAALIAQKAENQSES